jgi:uncharacterized protein (DUF433 family)
MGTYLALPAPPCYDGNMDRDRIELKAGVMGGKPVITGTRLTVQQILQECAAGLTAHAIVGNHPFIEEADVAAALRYAAEHLAAPSVAAE